jgi:hypothetical protein
MRTRYGVTLPKNPARSLRAAFRSLALFITGAGFATSCLTGCAIISNHKFIEPARDWQSRNGQLLYRTAKTTLIGEVLIRFSKTGEFELTFSKGSGLTLLTLRQDSTFASIKGPLARSGWAGPIATAPRQLRGWLALRDQLQKAQTEPTVRYVSGTETFIFRF